MSEYEMWLDLNDEEEIFGNSGELIFQFGGDDTTGIYMGTAIMIFRHLSQYN
jgi:hypothetical protein